MDPVSATSTAVSRGRRCIAKLAVSSGVLLALVQPAAAMWIRHGNGTYSNVPDDLIFAIAVVVVVGIAAAIASFITMGVKPSPPPEKTADEYNADAVILAAKRLHTEMMTELRKAEIEAARIEAIHEERDEIIAHDKKLRDLNARRDQNRRSE